MPILSDKYILQQSRRMLKRLFQSNEIEKLFKAAKIDSSHHSLSVSPLVDLARSYFTTPNSTPKGKTSHQSSVNCRQNQQTDVSSSETKQNYSKAPPKNKKKEELIGFIIKKLGEQKEVGRIKVLVGCHAIIRKTFDEQFMQIIAEEMDKYIQEEQCLGNGSKQSGILLGLKKMSKVKGQQDHHLFVKKHLISFYCHYIKKFILNIETYRYALDFDKASPEEVTIVEAVSQGFIILNLVNYILQSQGTFNKMGRYYIDHQEVMNLYVMYLQDLVVYNAFFKGLVRLILSQRSSLAPETMRHCFLFITEAQKSSDRLYEYFHNRYYYWKVKKIVNFPQFFTLEVVQFQDITKIMKGYDKELVLLVKNSKFSQEQRGRQRCKTMIERQADNRDLNRTQMPHINKREQSFALESFNQQQLNRSQNTLEQASYATKTYTLKKQQLKSRDQNTII